MTKKFLPFVLLSVFSCGDGTKSYPAQNEDYPDFDANPNKFNHFQDNFPKLVTFIDNLVNKKSKISPELIRKCVKYVVHFEGLNDFYEFTKDKEFLKQPFINLICTLASYHGNIVDADIAEYEKINKKSCPMKEVVKMCYTDLLNNVKNGLIWELIKKSIAQKVQNLMVMRADVAFIVVMAIIYEEKLSEKLLNELDKDKFFALNADYTDNSEIVRKVFLDELELKEIKEFTTKACKNAKKSQYDIFIEDFEKDFFIKFPMISFPNAIKSYLKANKNLVIKNVKDGVKEFFKTNYQQYHIRFQEGTVYLLAKYLTLHNTPTDTEVQKKEMAELLVLFFLNFYSEEGMFNNFVFKNMGSKMLHCKVNHSLTSFNTNIDVIVQFIKENYNEMDKDLFKEVTKKEILDGEKIIMDELLHQLEIGKMI